MKHPWSITLSIFVFLILLGALPGGLLRGGPTAASAAGFSCNTASFTAPTFYATGPVADDLALGDVNGDGNVDLAIPDLNGATAEVRLGLGNGTFAASSSFATGPGPIAIALGDLNADGKQDLAVVNTNANNVSVLLGNGNGTFQTQQLFPVGPGPFSVALADFNSDGKTDVVTANEASSVSVLLNTTVPGSAVVTFTTQSFLAGSGAPIFVATGDLNGDGRPDLVVSDFSGSRVFVLLNTTATGSPTASFAAPQVFAVGSGPRGISLADFNADGRLDLAVVHDINNDVSVLLNTTAPGSFVESFTPQQTFPVGGVILESHSVGTSDFNGDGKTDLAVGSDFSGFISVLRNTTAPGAFTPAFAAQQTFAAGTPVSVAAADLNADGKPDLVATDGTGNTVAVLLNTCPGSPDVSTALANPGPILVGASDSDTATLVGATANAGGTMSYVVYTDAACSVLMSSAGTKTVTNAAVPPSDSVPFLNAGTFYWQASYSGDVGNNPAKSICTSETVIVNQNRPTLATTLVPHSPVQVGTAIHDTALLTGATGNAGGSVTYAIYTDAGCTTPYAAHQPGGNPVTVTNSTVPNSGNVTFDQAGTFYWQGVYSGDANNSVASSACVAETLVVNANLPTVTTISPAASITQTSATLSGNLTDTGGGAAITSRGIVFALTSANPLPALGGAGVTQLNDAANTTGPFTENATTLLPGANYVFRAFATNQAGTSYGATVSFTTPLTGGTATPPFKGGPTPVQGPSLTKAFGAVALNMGGSTTLTFTVSNQNAIPLTGVSFTDALPAGISIAGAVSGTCPSGLISTTPSSVVLTGALLNPGQSCSFSVTVTALTEGTWINTAAAIANGTNSGPTASATLTVGTPPAPIVKKGL